MTANAPFFWESPDTSLIIKSWSSGHWPCRTPMTSAQINVEETLKNHSFPPCRIFFLLKKMNENTNQAVARSSFSKDWPTAESDSRQKLDPLQVFTSSSESAWTRNYSKARFPVQGEGASDEDFWSVLYFFRFLQTRHKYAGVVATS